MAVGSQTFQNLSGGSVHQPRPLNRQEELLLKELKKLGIVKDLDPMLLAPGVFFYCGDCDRSPDTLEYHRRAMRTAGIEDRLHHIALNGGPLNLVHAHSSNPKDNRAVQRFLVTQIRGSKDLKMLKRLKLLPHWPCSQGEKAWAYDMERYLHEAALAAQFAMSEVPRPSDQHPTEVVSRLHLHREHGMNTYHFSVGHWLASRRASQLSVA